MTTTKFDGKIRLSNSGGLQLFFLGTGSAFSKVNFQNNLLVIKGDSHLLIDCGTTCPYAFSTFNTSVGEVENLLITHSHADHAGGLEEVALTGKYVTERAPNIIITDKFKKVLWNDTLKGGCALGEENDTIRRMTFDDYFTQIKPKPLKNPLRPMAETSVGSLKIIMFRTNHISSKEKNWNRIFYSAGVLIDGRILFTGDTKFDRQMLEYFDANYKIEAIFHDCQFFPGGVHAFYGDLAGLPENLKRKMYLCHYSENFRDFSPEKDGFAGFAEPGVYYNF